MSVEEIEAGLLKLPLTERRRFLNWVFEHEDRWNRPTKFISSTRHRSDGYADLALLAICFVDHLGRLCRTRRHLVLAKLRPSARLSQKRRARLRGSFTE